MIRWMKKNRPGLFLALAALVALALLPAGAGAKMRFTTAARVPDSPPKGDLPGPEPSMAFSPHGKYVYLTAPTGGDNGGVGFWRSSNRGRSFDIAKSMGSKLGGGDSDVSVGPDGTVFVADLELVANALCRSNDQGKHFDAGCDTGIASDQEGLDSDREWVTPSPTDPNLVYFSYHDLAAEIPLVFKSTDGGQPYSFVPCGPVLAPGGEPFINFIPGGTDVGKPVVQKDGTIVLPITEPVNPATPIDPYNAFYVAIAKGGCDPTTIFKNVTVWSNPNADLANIFSYMVEDGAGNLYALATGKTGADGNHYGVYIWVSHDTGKTWSKTPIRVDGPRTHTATMGAIAGGPGGGDIAVGYYSSRTASDPNSDKNVWNYVVAKSTDGGRTFHRRRVTRSPVHYGAVCNKGILCTSGRNLADFSSVGVDPQTGCIDSVFAGDPYDKDNPDSTPAAAYFTRQTGGCFRHGGGPLP